jgi:hypothetical protein
MLSGPGGSSSNNTYNFFMSPDRLSAVVRQAVKSGTVAIQFKLLLARVQLRFIRSITSAPVFRGIFERLGGEWGSFGFFLRGTYFVCHQAGLFSTLSGVAQDILSHSKKDLRVKSTFSLHLYKNNFWADNWPNFFYAPSSRTENPRLKDLTGSDFSELWNASYAELNILQISDALRGLLRPSDSVLSLRAEISDQYGVNTSSTLGVHFRATDKVNESPTPSLSQVRAAVDFALEDSPNLRIVVLTDDSAFADAFSKIYPSAVFLTNLPFSSSGTGAHFLGGKNREEQGLIFFASALLISQCEKVVTHTGNGALWEVIYRGTFKGVTQLRGEHIAEQ